MARRKDPPYLLTVLSGPNAGAELGLSGAQKSLGGNTKQDIQLDDLPGAALRFMIEGDRLTLKPVKGVEISTRDGSYLPSGRSSKLPLPTQITVDGHVSLHLCRVANRGNAFTRRVPIFAAAAAMIAVFGFGLSTLVSTSGLATASVAPITQAVVEAPEEVAAKVAPCDTTCVEEAAQRFRDLAEEVGLPGVIVTPDGDIVRVSTEEIAKGDPRWSSARAAYDKEWAARVPLLLERTRPTPQAPFSVKSVWLGDRPEVTTRKGASYTVGSSVPGGWTVTAIRSGSVDLSAGNTSIRIEF